MGYVKMLDGFIPGRAYHFSVKFQLATNVESGLIGVGGSSGEGVTVKCGVTATEPATEIRYSGSFAYHRMNIDTGAQANSGKDMAAVGDMTKPENNRPGEYEFKAFQAELSILDKVENSGQISSWAKEAIAWTMASEVFKPAEAMSPQSPITMEELTCSIGQIVAAA